MLVDRDGTFFIAIIISSCITALASSAHVHTSADIDAPIQQNSLLATGGGLRWTLAKMGVRIYVVPLKKCADPRTVQQTKCTAEVVHSCLSLLQSECVHKGGSYYL